MVILILAMIGIIGIVCGIFAFRFIRGAARHRVTGPDLILPRRVALAVGALLGAVSVPLTAVMKYPYGPSRGQVAGVPFMVSYFDAGGRDYVGPLTAPAVLANLAFWALLPQMVLAGVILVMRWQKAQRGREP